MSNIILSVVKRNPLFLHEIEWKHNGFLFTTPNISALNTALIPTSQDFLILNFDFANQRCYGSIVLTS